MFGQRLKTTASRGSHFRCFEPAHGGMEITLRAQLAAAGTHLNGAMMAVNKKKSEDLKIQHVFSLREETEEQAKVAIIKEERDDIRIEHPFSLKQEETEQQTGLMTLKEESQEFNEKEEKYIYETHQDFLPEEKSFSCSETKKDTGTRIFTCPQCGTSSSVNIKTLKSA
ncbi:uncharacterized protein [Pseudorasbora parva]|uniref:uncharacterized protein isoform X2 n=1 Tax=Pseudorasbora parva TaxID=51549 RepID=UPI00351F273C